MNSPSQATVHYAPTGVAIVELLSAKGRLLNAASQAADEAQRARVTAESAEARERQLKDAVYDIREAIVRLGGDPDAPVPTMAEASA